MEINNFIKLLKNYSTNIFLSCILFTSLFALLYFVLPEVYLAEGTIFAYPTGSAKQQTEVSNEMNYSRNMIAISNSPEFKNLIKESSISKISFSPLIGVVGSVKLKEISPNILSLSVSGSTEDEVSSTYAKYLNHLRDFSTLLKKGNSSFELSELSQTPVITKVEKNIYLFLLIGFVLGFFISSIYYFIKRND